MTLSWPSFLAAATRPFMPPKAAAEVAVLASTAAVLALAVPPAAAVLVELEELEQPAARSMEPTAATLATIALDARKINPPMLPPGDIGAGLCILARHVESWLTMLNGRLPGGRPQPSVSRHLGR